MNPPLYGLLLAGGRSRRMGQDKASLVYGGDGLSQTERGLGLLNSCCEKSYLSVRTSQQPGAGTAVLEDRYPDAGPLGGILTAFDHAPDAAWLVVACDLPFLDERTLAPLLAARGDGSAVHAYASRFDGLPEPLCAIYEPAFAPVLRRHFEAGHGCPRRILREEGLVLLPLPENGREGLDNVNTPEELLDARARLAS